MSWKKEITRMCTAFAKAEDQSLTSEERKEHREKYLRIRTNLLCELQLLHAHFCVLKRAKGAMSEQHEEDCDFHGLSDAESGAPVGSGYCTCGETEEATEEGA